MGEDIVQSLEGADFACGDIVVFFAAISVDPSETEEHTVELDFLFLGQPTGQDGVGFDEIVSASANTADSGHVTEGDEAVSIVTQAGGHPDDDVTGTIEITNLGVDDEQFILRIETRLACTPGTSPTGNLQAALTDGRVTEPEESPINTGQQTIPFQQAGDIPDPEDYELIKTANPTGPVDAGELIGFDITITNTGDAPLANVVLTDLLPAGDALNWIESPDQPDCSIDLDDVLSCEFEVLDVGESRTVHLEATSNTESCGVLDNVADATADIAGDRTDDASVTVECPPGPEPPDPPGPPDGPSGPPDGPGEPEGSGAAADRPTAEPTNELPFTGSDMRLLALIGFGVLGSGLGGMALAHRRLRRFPG